MDGLTICYSLISMISVQIILANILSQDYSRLPLLIVIQCFNVTDSSHFNAWQNGIRNFHISYLQKSISNQMEMFWGESSAVLNKQFHSFSKYSCTRA